MRAQSELNEFACSQRILSDRSCRRNQPLPDWQCKCLHAGIGWLRTEPCGSITTGQTNQTKCWSLNSTSCPTDWPCSEWARGTSTSSSGSAYDEASCSPKGPVSCNGLSEGRPPHLSQVSEETWTDWCLCKWWVWPKLLLITCGCHINVYMYRCDYLSKANIKSILI